MLGYIETRCVEWATWSRMRQDGAWWCRPSQFCYREPLPHGTAFDGSVDVCNFRALEMEEAVAFLFTVDKRLGLCICATYRDQPHMGAAILATWLNCGSTRTYWRR